MELSTKELRSHTKLALDAVRRGKTVTITYRGRPNARVVRLEDTEDDKQPQNADCELFGLWADREDLDDVAAHVRTLRQSRFP
jgi:prevent-host-death family protein